MQMSNKPSAIIELVRKMVITNMGKKFEKDTWTTFHLIAPTSKIINVKCEKSQ